MVLGECEEETASVREETVASACHVLACPSVRPGRGGERSGAGQQNRARRRGGRDRPVQGGAAVRRRARASASLPTWARGHRQTGAGSGGACSAREALVAFSPCRQLGRIVSCGQGFVCRKSSVFTV